MTKKVALFVDNGGEELELIAPLDIMRRANLEVDLISANNAEYVIGAHNIKIIVDKKINDIEDILEYDAIVIGHSQFEKIPMSKEYQKQHINNEIREIVDNIKRLKEENKYKCFYCEKIILEDEIQIQ